MRGKRHYDGCPSLFFFSDDIAVDTNSHEK